MSDQDRSTPNTDMVASWEQMLVGICRMISSRYLYTKKGYGWYERKRSLFISRHLRGHKSVLLAYDIVVRQAGVLLLCGDQVFEGRVATW